MKYIIDELKFGDLIGIAGGSRIIPAIYIKKTPSGNPYFIALYALQRRIFLKATKAAYNKIKGDYLVNTLDRIIKLGTEQLSQASLEQYNKFKTYYNLI